MTIAAIIKEFVLFGVKQAYACMFGGFLLLFWRTQVYFRVHRDYRAMPLLLGWFLVALFIWLAENIATYVNIWIYPNQMQDWSPVSLAKLSSWYLLMLLSFVLVTTINRVELPQCRAEAPGT